MYPIRVNLGERPHDEPPFVRPRMGDLKAGPLDDVAAIGDEVEIERARGVPGKALPVKRLFDGRKRLQNRHRGQRCLDKGDTVAILRVIRVGPGGGTPPARPGQHGQSRRREARQRRLKEFYGGRAAAGQIAAEGDDYRLLKLRSPDV